MFPLTSYYDENNCLSVSVVLCLCQFHASIEGKLPHCNTRIKLPEAQRQDPYDGEMGSDAILHTHTQTHSISQSLSLFPLFQKRRRAGTMRVTLSPGRYWSTSLSSSSTPRLRGRPGPRRKRASSDPRSVRLARGHKSHRNIIARMGMSALVIIFLWREQPWVCV